MGFSVVRRSFITLEIFRFRLRNAVVQTARNISMWRKKREDLCRLHTPLPPLLHLGNIPLAEYFDVASEKRGFMQTSHATTLHDKPWKYSVSACGTRLFRPRGIFRCGVRKERIYSDFTRHYASLRMTVVCPPHRRRFAKSDRAGDQRSPLRVSFAIGSPYGGAVSEAD